MDVFSLILAGFLLNYIAEIFVSWLVIFFIHHSDLGHTYFILYISVLFPNIFHISFVFEISPFYSVGKYYLPLPKIHFPSLL